MPSPAVARMADLPVLLRAEPAMLCPWLDQVRRPRVLLCVAAIVLGAGIYGAVFGAWRSALQACYTGLKFPLVILLTTLGNALLNAMLAPLLGLALNLRQCLMVLLMTFAIAAVILGAFAPVAAFLVWNTSPLSAATRLSSPEYAVMQLGLVSFIVLAGVTGNLSLFPVLREWSGSFRVARNVLLAWLAVNLLLGSQISWVLRPFIWDPVRPEEFIGREYLRGSFYEPVFEAARRLAMADRQ